MILPDRIHPDPDVNLETERYWEGCRQGMLLLKKCNACDKVYFYPRAICPFCLGGDTEWFEASGKGSIYTYSVMRRAAVPYAIAYVRLQEGVTMMTNIVGCDSDDIAIGKAVEVTFGSTVGGMSVPVFRLCS